MSIMRSLQKTRSRRRRCHESASYYVVLSALMAVLLPSSAHAYTSVNPRRDNIFLHLTPEQGHDVIVILIYFSFWLGALGWDIFSTLQFDLRIVRETNWRSTFSILNSLAYFVSRYGTFAWMIRSMLDGITISDNCSHSFSISASLYGVCVCGTYFVFLFRTANLWKLQLRAVFPLGCIMGALIAICAALPWTVPENEVPGKPFCSWQVGGALSYTVLSLCALFDLTNFILLTIKLSKPGFKGLWQCLLPQTKSNYDHEYVSRMLLQRTGIFVVVQFVLLISIAVLYATAHTQGFQLMQVAAFHAISASMAGRIFRRAWKLTREHSPAAIAQPPSYSPEWLHTHNNGDIRRGSVGRATVGTGGVDSAPIPKVKTQSLLEDDASYVEGELQTGSNFGVGSSSKEAIKSSLSVLPRTQRREGVSSSAASHAASSCQQSRHSADQMSDHSNSRRLHTAIEMAEANHLANEKSPSLTTAEIKASTLSSKVPIGSAVHRGPRAKTSHGSSGEEMKQSGRVRPSTSHVHISPPVQIISPSADPSSSAVYMTSRADSLMTPGAEAGPSTVKASISAAATNPKMTKQGSLGRASGNARRPTSSGSVGSSTATERRRDLRPMFVASPPITTTVNPLPGPSGSGVIDLAAAKASIASMSIPAMPVEPSPRESGGAPDPLQAFHSAVLADESRHGATLEDTGEDAARPRTSRGGPLSAFGTLEPRRFEKSVCGSQQYEDPMWDHEVVEVSTPRPGTSHGRASGMPGTFSRLKTPEVDSSGAGGSDPDGHPTVPAAQPTSAIDETYRHLEKMATLSRTTTNSSSTSSISSTLTTTQSIRRDGGATA